MQGQAVSCIFCSIIAGDAPAEIVFEDDSVMAFMDINPASPGHTLVVPKEHFQDLMDIEPDLAAAVMRVATRVSRAAKRSLGSDGVNLFLASGRAAFQSVFHVHMHVIPRWQDDGLRPPWRPARGNTSEIHVAAGHIRDQLRSHEE